MVGHYDWMQMTYGFPGQGIEPFTLLLPGDLALPSPPGAMALLGFDFVHLRGDGYAIAGQDLWNDFYARELIDAIFVGGFAGRTTDRWSATLS